MRKLDPPQISFELVFDTCISNINEVQKAKYASEKSKLIDSANDYVAKAKSNKIHELSIDRGIGELPSIMLKKLYTNKLAKLNQPGRKFYGELMIIPRNQLCPYCDSAEVKQLDHVLAKAHYSRFSVLPINLVPTCSDCNFAKKDVVINKKSDLHFHPYFDLELNYQWLHAKVIEDENDIIITFSTKYIDELSTEENNRIRTHFTTFNLNKKFSILAGTEINSQFNLRELYEISPDELKVHVDKQASGFLARKPNYWRTAMYCALRDSEWFLNDGVKLIK